MKAIQGSTLFFALMFLVFMFSAFAYSSSAAPDVLIEKYTHVVELAPENSFEHVEILLALQDGETEVALAIPPRVRDTSVIADGKPKDCKLTEKESHTLLACTFSPALSGKHSLSVRYATNYPLFHLKDRILYKSEYKLLQPTQELVYILKLPPGAIIPEEKEVSFFVNPKADKIYSDGRRIILRWERNNVDRDFGVSAMFQPAPLQQRMQWAWFAAALALIVVVLLILRRQKKGKRKEKGNGENGTGKEYTALLPEERAVVELLQKVHGSGIWQKQLQLQSGLSKVKLSRLLQRLEKRGVVRKEEWGNTNKIHLLEAKEQNREQQDKEQNPHQDSVL